MKNIVIYNDNNQEVYIKNIQEFETIISATMSNDYKEFLLKYNGGYPQKNVFPLVEDNAIYNNISETNSIKLFSSIQQLIYGYRYNQERIPHELIEIANDPFGNRICLGIKDKYYGKVYFWDHDWESEDDEPPTYDNLSLIADNFTDFINMLFMDDILTDENHNILKDISIHDKYSWPFSIEVRQHGSIITDFFAQAPAEVEDYIIEEVEETKDLVLKYTIKSEDKQYIKHLDKQGKIVKQLVLGSSEDYPPL